MKWVVGNLVFDHVVEDVFQSPVGKWVALGQSTSDWRVFKKINPGALKSLPTGAAINHAVCVERLQAALERLHLANTVILINILLPEIGTIALVICRLVTNGNTIGAKDLGFKVVSSFELRE